jgi:hypothetical protein
MKIHEPDTHGPWVVGQLRPGFSGLFGNHAGAPASQEPGFQGVVRAAPGWPQHESAGDSETTRRRQGSREGCCQQG